MIMSFLLCALGKTGGAVLSLTVGTCYFKMQVLTIGIHFLLLIFCHHAIGMLTCTNYILLTLVQLLLLCTIVCI